MRKLCAIFVAVSLTATLWAQAPQKMSYQAVIRDASDKLVSNKQIGMEINIRQGSNSGVVVYTEIQTPTTNANGLVSIEIGAEVGFNTINWGANTYFIETKTAVVAPLTTYTITGISQLLSVPYALNAKTAESISGTINESDPTYAASQASKITANDITKLSNLSNINTGDQDLSGLATTTSVNTSLANKVDKEINKGLSSNDYTSSEKYKLTTVASGAEVNVNADWNATSGDAQIYNKPDLTQYATKIDVLQNQIDILQLLAGLKIKDIDGNIYNTVTIGTQTWLKENLKVTKYNDGTSIPIVTDATAWAGLSTDAYCWYNNDKVTNGNTYGALYNWYTVNTNKLCPTGWHVPSYAELSTLTDFLGGFQAVKLKETGTAHWIWSETNTTEATNESGFTALPGGYRYNNGPFSSVGYFGYWWSATENDATNAWNRFLSDQSANFERGYADKKRGFSVRCLKN